LAFQCFDFERSWWRLFQKRVVRNTFYIYVFIYVNIWQELSLYWSLTFYIKNKLFISDKLSSTSVQCSNWETCPWTVFVSVRWWPNKNKEDIDMDVSLFVSFVSHMYKNVFISACIPLLSIHMQQKLIQLFCVKQFYPITLYYYVFSHRMSSKRNRYGKRY